MGKTLYLECGSGISGDMTVAALLDLGADEKVLRDALAGLPLEGYEIAVSRVKKSGLDVCDFDVKLDHVHANHDHDMEYLYGASDHEHAEGHAHSHDGHEQGAAVGHHHHEHRGLPEIQDIITRANLTKRAEATALRVFDILAAAEAKAHGVPIDQVHFHEVGAVDSIVDIAAAAVCLDNLDITEVIIPELTEGRGHIRCQHGVIPVPVPAVLNIVQAEHLQLHLTDMQGELVTPTGAAIAAAVRTSSHLPERFEIQKVGMGCGKRAYERPSILRAMLIMAGEGTGYKDTIFRLETNLDDCTGEALGHCMECLFEAGARDVYYTPVYMKKNRPAVQLNVICTKESVRTMEEIIFRETTTIGIRREELERTILPREKKTILTALGEAEVKVCTLPDGTVRIYPEYEAVRRLAKEKRVSYQQAAAAVAAASESLF